MYQKYCAAEELRSKALDTHGLRVWHENGVCADQVISATKKEAGWWLKCMKPTLVYWAVARWLGHINDKF